jgi:hypothetical protein
MLGYRQHLCLVLRPDRGFEPNYSPPGLGQSDAIEVLHSVSSPYLTVMAHRPASSERGTAVAIVCTTALHGAAASAAFSRSTIGSLPRAKHNQCAMVGLWLKVPQMIGSW